ncbi:MAG: DUF4055 domain-containing protein [Pseudomonadota bacterium]
MSIDYQREDYKKAVPEWELLSDVVAGERVIKERDSGLKGGVRHNQATAQTQAGHLSYSRKRYLPMPNATDLSLDNLARYENYLARAVFYNATGRTLRGLVGTAFKRAPEVELDQLDYLLKDADGQGVGLLQQAQAALAAVMKAGRFGLWVDFPATGGESSRADLDAGNVRPTILAYKPDSIINWRTEKVGAEHRLALVVLSEVAEEVAEDGYSVTETDQIRVLRMDYPLVTLADETVTRDMTAAKVYQVEVHKKVEGGSFELAEQYTPADAQGASWDRIPFTFIGAQDNNPSIDQSPLLDMAVVNLAHYRNSADYEDSAFFCGQPQPYMTGLDEEWRDWLEKNGVYIGARAPIMLPVDAEFGFAQAQPNTLVKEAMDQKEQQMRALGARLLTKGEAVRTATEAQNDNETEHSVLSLVAENVSEAYTSALQWAALYQGIDPDSVSMELSRDYMEVTLDAQTITALVAAWQGGALPDSDMIANFKRGGLIDPERADDDILEELSEQRVTVPLDDAESSAN